MKLPRYTVSSPRAGRPAYHWQVPKRLRVVVDGAQWPLGVVRLPDDEALMFATASALNAKLDAHRIAVPTEARAGALPWLIARYEASPYFTPLRDKTKRAYRQLARYVLNWSVQRNHPHVASITTPGVLLFLAGYDSRRSLRDHIATYLGVVLEYARRTGLIAINPARQLGLKRARRLKPIRVVNLAQVLAIADKARELGLPYVALGTLLHFDLGQRQGDLLRLEKPRDYRDGVFHFKQSKTDQVVTIRPFLSETRAALDALPPTHGLLIADWGGRAIEPHSYVRDFRKAASACGITDLWEMELRHSCVIYMEQAGLTPGEIATRTGHSLSSVLTILENYRYRDPVVAQQGAGKLEDYRNKIATQPPLTLTQ